MIPLPDPPLRSGDLLLRPWRIADAPALVDAWADEEIQRWTAVPPQRDLAYAERWIAGWEARRAADLALDLVVERGDDVVGEVGLSALDPAAGTVEIGWWTGPAHRGQGLATAAVTLVVTWSRSTLGLDPIASVDPANPVSVAVARAAAATLPV